MLVIQSCPLFVTPRTVACQAPLSMGFSRQEYWCGLPFLSPGHLPNPEIKPAFPALQVDSLPSEPPGKQGSGKKETWQSCSQIWQWTKKVSDITNIELERWKELFSTIKGSKHSRSMLLEKYIGSDISLHSIENTKSWPYNGRVKSI